LEVRLGLRTTVSKILAVQSRPDTGEVLLLKLSSDSASVGNYVLYLSYLHI
jgi:hypothetical protein